MRILKVSYEFPPIGGGGARVVEGLAKELVHLGHEVDLVTMHFRGLPYYERVHGINVYRVPCVRMKESICRPAEMVSYLAIALPFIRRIIRKNKYDINHTHFIFPDGVLSRMVRDSAGLPYVITAHGSDVPGYNPNRFINLHKTLKPLWLRVVTGAESLISPSQSLAELIQMHHPHSSIKVIPNGIRVADFDLTKKQINRVLIASRFFERKGVQYFLKALDGLDISFIVDIVGTGPHLATLKSMAENLDIRSDINFHGWMDNTTSGFHELFEKAGIFVLPSESENFPIVLLEAMAANLAIITTKGTGCEEVVGDAGLLVPIRDPDAIRRALIQIAGKQDMIERMGRAARDRVIREFDWSVVTNRYLDVYRSAIKHE